MVKELALLFGCIGRTSMVALREHKGPVRKQTARTEFHLISRHTRESNDMATIREVSYQLLRRHGITTIFRDRAPSLCEPSRGSWHRQRDADFVNAWSSRRPLVITSGQQVRAMVGRRDDRLMLTVVK